MSTTSAINALLEAASEGDESARQQLLPHLYRELHALAHRQLRRGNGGDGTLCTTALVHEAFLRLSAQEHVTFRNRAHFLGYSARVMRSIVVDQARRRKAAVHGGDLYRVTWNEEHSESGATPLEIIALDEALDQLDRADPRLARLAELRIFGGLKPAECSEVLDLSERSIFRLWRKARAVLGAQLSGLPNQA